MKYFIILLFVISCASLNSFAQTETVTLFEAVKIKNEKRAEALFYYENNWKMLRENALKKGYIHSFEFVIANRNEKADFDIILITRYKDRAEFEKSEENFQGLIKARGEIRLKNELKPDDFRQSVFSIAGKSLFYKKD